MNDVHQSSPEAPVAPGDALQRWLSSAPSTGFERWVRADVVLLIGQGQSMREQLLTLTQALEDWSHKARAEQEHMADGHHTDDWLDGYRVGYAHAQQRLTANLQNLVRALAVAAHATDEEAPDGGR